MKEIIFIFFMLLVIKIELAAQIDYHKFISKILITHEKNNDYKNNAENLKRAILNNKKDNIYLKEAVQIDEGVLDSLREVFPESIIESLHESEFEYEFITRYSVNFRKMLFKKKRLQREKFFNYLSTKKINHVETYVFRNGVFQGSLRNSATGILYFVCNNNDLKKIAENFYEQIHKKINYSLFFCTRIPFSQDFIIVNDSVKPIGYDDNFKWMVFDIQDFINDDRFHLMNYMGNNDHEFIN